MMGAKHRKTVTKEEVKRLMLRTVQERTKQVSADQTMMMLEYRVSEIRALLDEITEFLAVNRGGGK